MFTATCAFGSYGEQRRGFVRFRVLADIWAKVLNSSDDAHTKTMSTFETMSIFKD